MDITACTVSFNNSEEIRWNIALEKYINPESSVHWIITENSPDEYLLHNEAGLGGATVLEGVESGHAPTFHHTLALSKAVRMAKTRFVMVVDPDFFVIMRNWQTLMVSHMIENNLSILGVPWHPRHTDKYRYFPAVHCTLFDTDRFPESEIDFRPDWPDTIGANNLPDNFDMNLKYFAVNPISNLLAKCPPFIPRKTYYTDTGGRLFKKYVNNKNIKYEMIDPVYEASIHKKTLKRSTRALECVLPDEFCYLPKYYPDTAKQEFLSKVSPQNVPTNWEQFTWQQQPFGFHMRRNADATDRADNAEKMLAKEIIDRIKKKSSVCSPVKSLK